MKKSKGQNSTSKGFSLIEVLICVALLIVAVVAITDNCNVNFRAAKKDVHKLSASVIGGQITDRYIYSSDFDNLKSTRDNSPLTAGDIVYEISPSVLVLNNTKYIYNINVADIASDPTGAVILKKVTTTVKWWVQPGQTYEGAQGYGENKIILKRTVYRNYK